MQSVMHFSYIRILCHDDIRALRMVYKLPIKRDNAKYDDTCRRDFPMGKLQKLMYLIGKLLFWGSTGFAAISTGVFNLTLIYLLIRYFMGKRSNDSTEKPVPIKKDKPMIKSKKTNKPHGYLWHDDVI